jgi:predicted nuclease of predicted toxin-antitoxin system
MAVALYMDHHVPRAITLGLRLRGVDVITAYEDGAAALDDPELLTRASALDRVLFTQDDDLLAEATRRQQIGISFVGLIYAHQLRVSIGQCVRDLETIAKSGEPEDLANRVEYLPL